MLKDFQQPKLKNYLQLHLIVFIWGFTAVLGKLITIDALPLVWYRMILATFLIGIYIFLKKISIKISLKLAFQLFIAGVIIALHWLTFFTAIKVSNVSVALACMATGAFFTALLEPIWYARKIIGYELLFGLLVIMGLYLIFKEEGVNYWQGILYALISAFLSAVFTLLNGKLVKQAKPAVISFYELGSGVLCLSIFILCTAGFSVNFFNVSMADWVYIFVLASVCTAYAFIASVKIMHFISPYTIMLTINLEPVYGIVFAFFIFGNSEKMGLMFYVGAFLIVVTILLNGVFKNRKQLISN